MKKDMEKVIKDAFADAYVVAKFNAKKKHLNEKDKWSVGRALVALNDCAQNPAKYFAPENTYDAWKKRAQEYVENHPEEVKTYGEQYVYNVAMGSIVQAPRSIVFGKIYPVIHDYYGYGDGDYLHFCEAVQDYYYRNEFKVIPYEPRIFDFAKKISKRAKIVKQKNPIKRAVMHWWMGNRREY